MQQPTECQHKNECARGYFDTTLGKEITEAKGKSCCALQRCMYVLSVLKAVRDEKMTESEMIQGCSYDAMLALSRKPKKLLQKIGEVGKTADRLLASVRKIGEDDTLAAPADVHISLPFWRRGALAATASIMEGLSKDVREAERMSSRISTQAASVLHDFDAFPHEIREPKDPHYAIAVVQKDFGGESRDVHFASQSEATVGWPVSPSLLISLVVNFQDSVTKSWTGARMLAEGISDTANMEDGLGDKATWRQVAEQAKRLHADCKLLEQFFQALDEEYHAFMQALIGSVCMRTPVWIKSHSQKKELEGVVVSCALKKGPWRTGRPPIPRNATEVLYPATGGVALKWVSPASEGSVRLRFPEQLEAALRRLYKGPDGFDRINPVEVWSHSTKQWLHGKMRTLLPMHGVDAIGVEFESGAQKYVRLSEAAKTIKVPQLFNVLSAELAERLRTHFPVKGIETILLETR